MKNDVICTRSIRIGLMTSHNLKKSASLSRPTEAHNGIMHDQRMVHGISAYSKFLDKWSILELSHSRVPLLKREFLA